MLRMRREMWLSAIFAAAAAFAPANAGAQPALEAGKPPAAALGDKAAGASGPARLRVDQSYGKLPLSFERNEGQTDARVKFLARGSGYAVYLTATGAVVALTKNAPHTGDKANLLRDPLMAKTCALPAESAVVRLTLKGANAGAEVSGLDELVGKSNYFIGNDPKKWKTDVPTYSRVRYRGIYPGIDLIYYGKQRQLESDYVLAPGAKPGAIALAIAGAERVSIAKDGALVMASKGGDVRLDKPVAYQDVNGERKPVAAEYRIKGNRRVGFAVGEYDRARPLVIDPVLVYSTYLGGSVLEFGYGIAVDSIGNAYVTGLTQSSDFPITSGAFQTALGQGYTPTNAFVTKLNGSGTALVYSTYLGGSFDSGQGIAVDSAGNAYVTGFTGSPNFPTTLGAFQTTTTLASADPYSPSTSAFVTKLDPSGAALVYSTYLGGDFSDSGRAIAVDSAGNAYVTGNTNSDNFPTSPGAFQEALAALPGALIVSNAFVTKLNPSGTALVYSTYLGGSGFRFPDPNTGYWYQEGGAEGQAIAVDSAGDAYVTGGTLSSDFPTTLGSFQTALGGPVGSIESAFVTKLNESGTSLVYSTYLGSSGGSFAYGIAVDSAGNAYVAGSTTSTNFPTTPGAFQTAPGGPVGSIESAFVTKLNESGTSLVYSTYLGSSGGSFAYGIAVDSAGNAYVAGSTTSTNFPTTPGAFQTSLGGPGAFNAFVTKLNASGTALVYSTYLGGRYSYGYDNAAADYTCGITLDSAGSAYICGYSSSYDFPATPGAFQTVFLETDERFHAFVAKLALGVNCALNDNRAVTVTRSGFSYSPITKRFAQILTLSNAGGDAIAGPIYVVLEGLTNATLWNATPPTACTAVLSSPYVSMPLPLNSGASAMLVVQFSDPTNTAITYTTRVLTPASQP